MSTDPTALFEPGCLVSAGIVVCSPGGVYIRDHWSSPDGCSDQARRIIHEPNSPYYGPTFYCECGDSYTDGFRDRRPFRRGWRTEAQKRFEQRWETALPEGTVANYDPEILWLESVTLPDGTVISRA